MRETSIPSSSDSTDADVIIVGGGPAGSTAAIALRRYAPALRVILLDKQIFPRFKSCGDGIGPGVKLVLERLNALSVMDGAPRPAAVRIGGPGAAEGYAQGPNIKGRDLSGYVLPRIEFDARLLALAASLGVDVRQDCRAIDTGLDGTIRWIATDKHSARPLRTHFMIAADGAYSDMRKALGVPPQDDAATHLATRTYADIHFISPTDAAELPLRIDFERALLPAYGWVFPLSSTRANIGVGVPLSILKARSLNLPRLLQHYIASLPERGIIVEAQEAPRAHKLPHAGHLPRLSHPLAALIGDAGSMINPLSGEGIVYGMVAAEMLAQRLGTAPTVPYIDISPEWERAFRSRFRAHLGSCWMGHRFMRSASWAGLVVDATAHDQSVLEDAALMLFGEERMHIRTGLRIIQSALTKRSSKG